MDSAIFNQRNFRFSAFSITLLVLFSLTASWLGFSRPGFAKEKISLALNWKAEPQFGGFYAADYKNPSVEIREGGSGTPTIQMITAGKVDFAVVSGDELLLARSKGSDAVAIFAVYQIYPQGIMVHEERGFKSLGEVFQSPGLIALQKGLPYVDFLSKKYAPIQAKFVPYLGGIGPFTQNPKYSQQCIVTSEPITAQAQGLKTKVFLISDSGFNPYSTVVVARRKTIQEKPELVKTFLQATRLGWQSYLENPKVTSETNLKMHKINSSLDLKVFDESAKAQIPFISTPETKKNGIGTMTESRWMELAEQLVELHIIANKGAVADILFQ